VFDFDESKVFEVPDDFVLSANVKVLDVKL
jgi:hypothetical protein